MTETKLTCPCCGGEKIKLGEKNTLCLCKSCNCIWRESERKSLLELMIGPKETEKVKAWLVDGLKDRGVIK